MDEISQTLHPVHELATSGNQRSVEDRKLYRAGQLNGSVLRDMLTRHGIRTTVNLRGVGTGQSWYEDELLVSKALGVLHFDFALSLRQEIDDETLRHLLRLLQKVPTPLLIHCSAGAHRVGLVAAIFQWGVLRRPPAEARKQLLPWYNPVPWLSAHIQAMDRTFDRFIKIAM